MKTEGNRTLLVNKIGAGILALSVAGFILFGVLGIGRTSPAYADFEYFYAAGQVWLKGENPYDPQLYAPVIRKITLYNDLYDQPDFSFAYFPTFAPFCIAMAILPHAPARVVMLGLNLMAVGLLAWLAVQLVTDAEQRRPACHSPLTAWLLASLIIGNPFTWRVVWHAQTTLLASVLFIGAWYLVRRRRECLAGVLLGLSTFKPHLVMLPALWLLLERRWTMLFTAAALAGVLAAYPFAIDGPVPVIRDWLHAISLYATRTHNQLGYPDVIGLPSAMVAAGLPAVPVQWPLLMALGIVGVLWRGRARLCPDDIPGLLLAIQLGLVYGHHYDLVLLAPLAAALWLHLADRATTWIWAILLVLMLFIPDRVMRLADIPLLTHWLTAMVLLALGWLLYLSYHDSGEPKLHGRRCQTDH